MRGRKPNPHNLKVLKGKAKGEALEIQLPAADDPSPPDWIDGGDASDEWARLYGLLSATGVLTKGDLSMLGHLCQLHSRCLKLYREGEAPTAAQITQLRAGYSEFGLTPASRTRVKAADADRGSNPFARLRAVREK